MEELESKALRTFVQGPRLYYRFVDDTIAALKKIKIAGFHEHLNSQNEHIKFTIERYNHEEGVAFLDSQNVVLKGGLIGTKVYR